MSYETDDKMVSHPDHYKSGKYEVIDIIDEFTKDLKGTEAVCTANAIKYILRWKKKNGIQDVKKAIWYLTHLVEHLESQAIHADPECAEKMKEFEDSIDISRESEFVQTGEWPETEPQVEKPTKKKNHCGTCAHQWNVTECPRAYPQGTIGCVNTAECCDKWTPAVTSSSYACKTCGYELRKKDLEPCKSCSGHSNWTPKESKDGAQ